MAIRARASLKIVVLFAAVLAGAILVSAPAPAGERLSVAPAIYRAESGAATVQPVQFMYTRGYYYGGGGGWGYRSFGYGGYYRPYYRPYVYAPPPVVTYPAYPVYGYPAYGYGYPGYGYYGYGPRVSVGVGVW
jgi:hypothetical protein